MKKVKGKHQGHLPNPLSLVGYGILTRPVGPTLLSGGSDRLQRASKSGGNALLLDHFPCGREQQLTWLPFLSFPLRPGKNEIVLLLNNLFENGPFEFRSLQVGSSQISSSQISSAQSGILQ